MNQPVPLNAGLPGTAHKEVKSLTRIFLLFALSLTLVAVFSFIYIYSDTKQDRINDLAYVGKVTKGFYEAKIHEWELALLSVGNRMVEIEDADARRRYSEKALEVYKDELLAFGLASATGEDITFEEGANPTPHTNLKSQDVTRRSFEYGLHQPGITLGESYYFDRREKWILPIRVPIKDANGKLIAMQTSAVSHKKLLEELANFKFDSAYRIHLVNKTFGSTQIFYPLRDTSVVGSEKLVYKVSRETKFEDESSLCYALDPFTGSDIFAFKINLNEVDHTIFISVDSSIVYSDVLKRYQFLFLIYLIVISLSVALFWYLRGKLSRAIDRLRSERAHFKSIIESTESLIGLFDDSKKLVAFNQAFFDSAKLTDNIELKAGMTFDEVVTNPEYRETFRQNMDPALAGEKYSTMVEYPGPDGTITFRFTYNPVENEGRVVGLSLFAENITEIKDYQRQLEDYNKKLEETVSKRTAELKGKNLELEKGYEKLKSTQQQLIRAEKMASLGILSAGIGHEINNPLNFIKHGSIALKMKLEEMKNTDLVELETYFHAIDEGVRRASNIVSSLSSYSRSAGDMEEICDVHKIVRNSLMMLTSRFRDKSINIETEFYAEHHLVLGNSGKLHQVFTNIIANAEQAIPDKGFIRLVSRNEGNKLLFSIEDSGVGMSEEVLSKIMDPFFTTKEQGEGTGLGMFISQMIIDEHHGEMAVTSQEGVGTIFTIKLEITPS